MVFKRDSNLKVQSDVATVLDERSMVTLIMLDLYAAFYVINHRLLLNEKVSAWVKSYLTNRTQCVSFADKVSPDTRHPF